MTRSFYGWWVVLAVFAVTLVGFGSAYTFGSFMAPLQKEFGVGRGTLSFVFGVAGFLYFTLGAITGPLADRFGTRPLVALGMALIGAGLIAASLATSAIGALSGYALGIGLGVGCAYVPAVTLIQRWFVRHRGLASGLGVSGIGVGTFTLPPLAQWLIEAYGWRAAYLALGLLTIGLGVVATLLIRENPQTIGQFPDGDTRLADQAPKAGLSVGEAIRSAVFVRFYAGMLLVGVGAFIPFVHLVPFAADEGIPPARASMLLALIGIGSTAGRFFLGSWADRIGRAKSFTLMCLGMGLTILWWSIAPGFWGLALFAFAFGIVYGGWVALAPALVTDLFGAQHAGAIIGALYTSIAIGTLVGPGVAGIAYERLGSYLPAIWGAAILMLAGTATLRKLSRSA